MALLFNPVGGDDPDLEDEDEGDELHAPSCCCDICTEQRLLYGTDDYDPDLTDNEDDL